MHIKCTPLLNNKQLNAIKITFLVIFCSSIIIFLLFFCFLLVFSFFVLFVVVVVAVFCFFVFVFFNGFHNALPRP